MSRCAGCQSDAPRFPRGELRRADWSEQVLDRDEPDVVQLRMGDVDSIELDAGSM
jgi:hypothetical protein